MGCVFVLCWPAFEQVCMPDILVMWLITCPFRYIGVHLGAVLVHLDTLELYLSI